MSFLTNYIYSPQLTKDCVRGFLKQDIKIQELSTINNAFLIKIFLFLLRGLNVLNRNPQLEEAQLLHIHEKEEQGIYK